MQSIGCCEIDSIAQSSDIYETLGKTDFRLEETNNL